MHKNWATKFSNDSNVFSKQLVFSILSLIVCHQIKLCLYKT